MTALRVTGLVTVCLVAACSDNLGSGPDGGGGGGPRTDEFVGVWRYDTGAITPNMCMVIGMAIPPIPLTGESVTISKNDATHITLNAGAGCNVMFTVSGSVATAAAGQTCAIDYMNVPVGLNVTSWTLTLSGNRLTSAQSGSAPLGGSSCTASGTGTLTKI